MCYFRGERVATYHTSTFVITFGALISAVIFLPSVFAVFPDTGPPSVILSDFLALFIHLSFAKTITCPA